MSEPYVETWSGKHFHPWNPKPEEITIEDIAHALSLQCRFNGHTDKFYSVAEHCVIMSRLVEPSMAIAGLLHDAAEAYIGDMMTPIKIGMREFRHLDALVTLAICNRFGVDCGQTLDPEFKALDHRLCAAEAEAFFVNPPGWSVKYKAVDLKPVGWGPKRAKKEYLKRFRELEEKKCE